MLEFFPDLLTVDQVRGILNIGKNTAYKLVHSGEIPGIRIGRSLRVPKKSILEYIEKSCYNENMAQVGSPSQ